jgi:hypothetical protein
MYRGCQHHSISSNLCPERRFSWHGTLTQKEFFSVKSAYVLSTKIRCHLDNNDASTSDSKENAFDWGRIWKMDILNKVKMFVWRMAHNALQVKRNIVMREGDLDTLCPMCSRFDEDPNHLFFKCKEARLATAKHGG